MKNKTYRTEDKRMRIHGISHGWDKKQDRRPKYSEDSKDDPKLPFQPVEQDQARNWDRK